MSADDKRDDEVEQVARLLRDHEQERAGRAQGPGDAPPMPRGMLVSEVIEASGLTRNQVKRALLLLQAQGRAGKKGIRHCLLGAGESIGEEDAQLFIPPVIEPVIRPVIQPVALQGAAPVALQDAAPQPKPHHVIGQLRVHPAGYGFVIREDGEDDVFIPARNRGVALDGDRVALSTWMGYKGTEGRVEEVLSRGRARLTGLLIREGRTYSLLPDDPRLCAQQSRILLPDGCGSAREGQSVLALITRYPSRPDEMIAARVVHALGEPGEPRTEIAKILLTADIPDEFPSEVEKAGERAPSVVAERDMLDRLDLRDRPFLTIDPENARDFDDAVCLEDDIVPGLTRLWVAVADVSHYVRPGSALDSEARVRGCSLYLPSRAIPMLPHPLSAGMCSLNPDVDRLAMVVGLDIDQSGQVIHESFAAAVIHSHGRLDYPGVAAALSTEGELRGNLARYREHLPQLRKLRDLTQTMRQRRLARGALDFDLPEAKVILDEDDPGRVRDVVRAKSNPEIRDAYRLVEDCMLAANEAVARFFHRRNLDCVYRVHDVPDSERLLAFAALALGHGLVFDPEAARSPLYLRGFLEKLKGRPMEQALSYLLLRALKKATYDIVSIGHFGLATADYLHFTSPIRRYPDLLVHRLLKLRLQREGLPAGAPDRQPPPTKEELTRYAHDASTAERRAMEVEREVVDLYRAILMLDQIGQEFDGTIVGITAFGIFVAIESPYVEGLIRTERLGGDFSFDAQTVRLSGRGQSYSLGDAVRVRIEDVSVTRRKIEMSMLGVSARSWAALDASPEQHPSRRRKPNAGNDHTNDAKKAGTPAQKGRRKPGHNDDRRNDEKSAGKGPGGKRRGPPQGQGRPGNKPKKPR